MYHYTTELDQLLDCPGKWKFHRHGIRLLIDESITFTGRSNKPLLLQFIDRTEIASSAHSHVSPVDVILTVALATIAETVADENFWQGIAAFRSC